MTSPADRAAGALYGLAIGDALGMPTQNLPQEAIRARYGTLDDFHPGPPDNEISHGVPAGHVTDDTDQAIILGRLFVHGGGQVDPHEFAAALLAWQERMQAAGSLDLLGPSTLRALTLVAQGVSPDLTGRWGDTNGAAMRIAPIGVGTPVQPLTELVDAVEAASRVTHNTHIGIAGAAAVAAAVSSGVEGQPIAVSFGRAERAARYGAERGHYTAGADVATRLKWAIELVDEIEPENTAEAIYRSVGVGLATQESVPAAFAVAALFRDDAWAACRFAAGLGGDCDTIAAMAGAIVGAHVGLSSFPVWVIDALEVANPDLGLSELAGALLRQRNGKPV